VQRVAVADRVAVGRRDEVSLADPGARGGAVLFDAAHEDAVGLGQTDRAFEWLQKACDERAAALMNVKVDPALDSLRGDRRFAALLACAGLW
jgi:hypothetical protein